MDRFHLMTVFVAVAEEEGFAVAARRLRMSPPAVTRAIAVLEERLGVRLLTRTTRLVRTTDAGARYLEDARRILLEAGEADEAAAGVNATPRGHLAVTAPVLFGRIYVMPVITAYQMRYKETTVSALFIDRVVNLVEEGLDVGIRIGPLPDSSLRAIRVGQVRRVVCASPAYLKAYGSPTSPADLARHSIIAATSSSATSAANTGKPESSSRRVTGSGRLPESTAASVSSTDTPPAVSTKASTKPKVNARSAAAVLSDAAASGSSSCAPGTSTFGIATGVFR